MNKASEPLSRTWSSLQTKRVVSWTRHNLAMTWIIQLGDFKEWVD